AAVTLAPAQEAVRPVRVTIQDEKPVLVEAPVLPVDPQPRLAFGFNQRDMSFGMTVEGKRIMYSQDGSTNNTMVRIDGQDMYYGQPPGNWDPRQGPLPKVAGRARHGARSSWVFNKLRITQILEVVPSKSAANAAPGQKRRLDTCLIRYV